MKVKTSITLDETLLAALDQGRRENESRSELIESAIRNYLVHRKRDERYTREIALMEKYADEINAEAEEVLSYQEW